MTYGSLFSGIGAGELCAESVGWDTKFHCEINPFCQQILKYYFPKSQSYADITNTDFTIWRGRIDVLSGSPPCQSVSVAGKRRGTEDARFLWPPYIRAVKEIESRWIVAENVRGLISQEKGMVLRQVLTDLEDIGYELQLFLLPAAGVNAMHLRERLWIVGRYAGDTKHYGSYDAEGGRNDAQSPIPTRPDQVWEPQGTDSLQSSYASHTRNTELQGGEQYGSTGSERKTEIESRQFSRSVRNLWKDGTTFSPICGTDNGISGLLDSSPFLRNRKLRGITFSKWRIESIKAYGNAWHVHVPLQIFKTINEYEHSLQ